MAALSWLRKTGSHNAGLLRNMIIVCRKDRQILDLQNNLLREMRLLGVSGESGVVEVEKLRHPFCDCDGCVLDTVIEIAASPWQGKDHANDA